VAAPFLLAAAVLIQRWQMLGLYQGGRTVVEESSNAEWKAANLTRQKVGNASRARRARPDHRLFPDRLSQHWSASH